jgi:hypothetical protein
VLTPDGGRGVANYGRVMTTTTSSPLAAVEGHTVKAAGLVSCPPWAALTEVATLMCVNQVHAVVVDPGAPRLITARDVVRATLAGGTSAEELIAPEAPSVAPNDTLLAAAELMVHAGEGHVVVRDHGERRARGVLSSLKSSACWPATSRASRGSSVRRPRARPSAAVR